MINDLSQSELGKKSSYVNHYSPQLLLPVARQIHRDELGIGPSLPFYGYDYWNAYEISWLNDHGKPMVAVGEFICPCTTPQLFESKSLKLYLNSFNHTRFTTVESVTTIIKKDLSAISGAAINVNLYTPAQIPQPPTENFNAKCLDTLDVIIEQYTVNPTLLICHDEPVSESLYTNLFKSNCPITHQPDWASVHIDYRGSQIDHASLLRYLISYRNSHELHEHCVERIFIDIMRYCQLTHLSVTARFTRRGGIDINPMRTTNPNYSHSNRRHWRQ